jgi:hypothetical protein
VSNSSRDYASGVEKALFLLSRGYCYEPTCQTPVLRKVNNEPRVNVQIAHIRAATRNGPRYDEGPPMQDPQRKSFSNLLLLCKPHHDEVDKEPTASRYSVALLHRWKADREGDLADRLEGLNGVTEASLQSLMASAVNDVRLDISGALGQLTNISQDTAELLRVLVAETFDRPYLDADLVASLANSATLLMHMLDIAPSLEESSGRLASLGLGDYVPLLLDAATEIKESGLPAVVSRADDLHQAAHQLGQASGDLANLETTVARLETATERLKDYNPVYQVDHPQRWVFFKRGAAVGAGAVTALAVLILILVLKSK